MSNQSSGASAPLGAAVVAGGVNFSVYSKHATAVDLLLFDDARAQQPSRVVSCARTSTCTPARWAANW